MDQFGTLTSSIPWTTLISSKFNAALAGVFSHFLLAQWELDFHVHHLLMFWLFGYGAATYAVYADSFAASDASPISAVFSAIWITFTSAAVYFSTILCSMAIYRVFFHRLRKFPGPTMPAVSKLFCPWYIVTQRQLFLEVDDWHRKYGDYVRIGPQELSIIDTNAVNPILGAQSKCLKGPWYEAPCHTAGQSLHSERSKIAHKERRRHWDQAFSTKSINGYIPRLERIMLRLLCQIQARTGKPLVINHWIEFFAFDVTGDIGFSHDFNMIERAEVDDLIKLVRGGGDLFMAFNPVPWLLSTFMRIPSSEFKDILSRTYKILRERAAKTPSETDVFSWLLKPGKGISLNHNADARLLVLAGSDTSSSVLVFIFYYLCKYPDQLRKLQTVVDNVARAKGFLDAHTLMNVPHLDGVINETMRLHPPVIFGLQRQTPPEGIMIGDKHIPGNSHVRIPHWSIQRDERYFPNPLSFIPERWTTEPELIKDKRAFMPFNVGQHNCVGQRFAMIEMRVLVANLIRQFDVTFAPGEDGNTIVNGVKDGFTTKIPDMNIVFTPRSGVTSFE
ncbi:cytochrome P450 [Lineolata rhizophorae]|uniref:Cytochrome P450 n=1 Tax=Lineolata rhizophorae TaxID=578093 RepID=A0A6A6NS27_9PEZI|nr:cytochrome P450 [Lineolata rhizophorae]